MRMRVRHSAHSFRVCNLGHFLLFLLYKKVIEVMTVQVQHVAFPAAITQFTVYLTNFVIFHLKSDWIVRKVILASFIFIIILLWFVTVKKDNGLF